MVWTAFWINHLCVVTFGKLYPTRHMSQSKIYGYGYGYDNQITLAGSKVSLAGHFILENGSQKLITKQRIKKVILYNLHWSLHLLCQRNSLANLMISDLVPEQPN